MTFSLVACDLESREWGVAVASKFLAVGSLVAWAEPEVGAVATQSWIHAAHGRNGLAKLANGGTAATVCEELIAGDDDRDLRQLGIVDAAGRTASYTGAACLDWAGERAGDGYTAQGNLLVSGETIDAMAETFEDTEGQPLARRLLAALAAGQAAGGDRRGQQAAALLVAKRGGGYGGADIAVDLRVDDHERPVDELERLLGLHELYFGSTPREEWIPVDDELHDELRGHLARSGFEGSDLAAELERWAGVENLEERIDGVDAIDPVVLAVLRNGE
jgi:uncharacterized Ntn-hydrolase superfamily protein